MYFSQNFVLHNKYCLYTSTVTQTHNKRYCHSTKNEVKKHIINELAQLFFVFSYI